ncbi:MAG: class I SAM-dependent methyltransferase, partial [Oscillospiraceae bacterium]|nr:class I SAM-dependent methyltransferase [Oscillospiraceae bacterium]
MKQINALSLAHDFITAHVKPGSFCIDATAGRGRDTAFLCRLAGPNGMVYAFDIQKEALDSTRTLLENEGLSSCARLIHDSHANMAVYARPESADCIVFNLGWLPGGDHDIHTDARS